MKKIILLVSLTTILASCISQKRIDRICLTCPKETIIEHDTLYKDSTVIHKDSIFVESDSSLYTALLGCDSLNNVYIKEIQLHNGQHISTTALLKNNILSLKAKLSEYYVYKTWFEKHRTIKITNRTSEIRYVKVNELTFFQKLFVKSGQLLWLLISIACLYYIIKYIIKNNVISKIFK